MSKCRIGRGGAGGGTSRRTSGCALGRQQARKALVTPRAHPGAATPLVATPRSPVSLERLGPVGRQRPHVPSLHDPVAQGTAYVRVT